MYRLYWDEPRPRLRWAPTEIETSPDRRSIIRLAAKNVRKVAIRSGRSINQWPRKKVEASNLLRSPRPNCETRAWIRRRPWTVVVWPTGVGSIGRPSVAVGRWTPDRSTDWCSCSGWPTTALSPWRNLDGNKLNRIKCRNKYHILPRVARTMGFIRKYGSKYRFSYYYNNNNTRSIVRWVTKYYFRRNSYCGWLQN